MIQFNSIYAGKRVLITGHTGFKGSWLSLWLSKLGAEIYGFSLKPPTEPNHIDLLDTKLVTIIGDITNKHELDKTLSAIEPEIVFHLAAQPIVRLSYTNPVDTYAANVMGTLNVCESCRATKSVKALIAITTDKVYKNREWWWGYRENDELGGYDPYSSSKSCADILLASYRDSFFNLSTYGDKHNLLLAIARAGNVIGGGDWAQDRLIPDIVRSASIDEAVIIRNPLSTRPWQHVLDCLSGYLLLGQKLLQGKKEYATQFNFGPPADDVKSVGEIMREAVLLWPQIKSVTQKSANAPHEARSLTLDCSKARLMLDWIPVWDFNVAIKKTIDWYREYYEYRRISSNTDIESYLDDAQKRRVCWIS